MKPEVEITYPVLTDVQLAKLPWNRLKNIMKMVRAVISSVEHYWGYDVMGRHYPASPVCILQDRFETWEERRNEAEKLLKPQYEYFNMLKKFAALLPHEPKKVKRNKNGSR